MSDNEQKTKTNKRLNVRETAAYIGISRHLVIRAIHRGELRALRFGRTFQVEPPDIEDYLRRAETVARPA